MLKRAALRLADRLISGNYVVVNSQGVVATDLEGRFMPGSRLDDILPGGLGEEVLEQGEIITRRSREFMVAAAPIAGSGGKVIVMVRMETLREIRQALFKVLARSLAWAVPLSLLASFLLAGWRPGICRKAGPRWRCCCREISLSRKAPCRSLPEPRFCYTYVF